MKQDEIIEMARQAGFEMDDSGVLSPQVIWYIYHESLIKFAKLIAAKEREKWKEIVEDQRIRLQALNEIIGGEESTTTGNILSYSRWEMRLEDAVKEEREACAKLVEDSWMAFSRAPNRRLDITPFPELSYVAKVIRARGEA